MSAILIDKYPGGSVVKVLVTGAAGFVGFHLSQKLLAQGHEVFGLDNLNDYYDVQLKLDRLAQLENQPHFTFQRLDLADRTGMEQLFSTHPFDWVAHMGAQAGVRYSLKNPHAYADSNLTGFVNVLEGCRHTHVKHLVFASSSSVYGANTKIPFSVTDNVDHPVSLYAATKKANELMAHTYSHLYGLPTTGLRFFTVYGPWGRPDMALFTFTRAIFAKQPIEVYNYGKMRRDFTYVEDVVEGVIRVLNHVPVAQILSPGESLTPGSSSAPYRIYNIGNNQPIELIHFIEVLEKALGLEAEKKLLPLQPGDVLETYADVDDLVREVGFRPDTPIEVGVQRFVDWYRSYYGV
ncbi:MAG: NAD-dependent epimerase [Leptolyngbyaceae cyanobacterium bins.59]|nr:NAD-dependent epimerase [Leptolyngbyaceae cyanobacterium bins.59]